MSPFVRNDEIENYDDLIVEKSGMEPDRVAQFIDLLFQYIEVIPAGNEQADPLLHTRSVQKVVPVSDVREAAVRELVTSR